MARLCNRCGGNCSGHSQRCEKGRKEGPFLGGKEEDAGGGSGRTPGMRRDREPSCLCRPQPAHSCSAAFYVFISTFPSAVPADLYLYLFFLTHAYAEFLMVTVSRGQHCRRKDFPIGVVFSLEGARSWPRTHILSQKRTFSTEMMIQNYKLVINVMCTLVGASGGVW